MAKKQKFLRLGYTQYSKLGVRRKKKQVYRKAKGIDNKVRLNMKGHLRNVEVGFRGEKVKRDLVNGLRPVKINNIQDLKNIREGEIPVVSSVGNKRKLEIAKYALDNKIRIFNLNSKKFIERVEEEMKSRKEKKMLRSTKIKDREKKAKEAEKKKEIEDKKKEETKKEGIEKKLEGDKVENTKDIKKSEEDKK